MKYYQGVFGVYTAPDDFNPDAKFADTLPWKEITKEAYERVLEYEDRCSKSITNSFSEAVKKVYLENADAIAIMEQYNE